MSEAHHLTRRMMRTARATCANIAATEFVEREFTGCRSDEVTLTQEECMALATVASVALGISEALREMDADDAICILTTAKRKKEQKALYAALTKNQKPKH